MGHIPEKITVKIPTKKPKSKELTEVQKMENKRISSLTSFTFLDNDRNKKQIQF